MCLVGMPSGPSQWASMFTSSGSFPIMLYLCLYKVLHMQPSVYLYLHIDLTTLLNVQYNKVHSTTVPLCEIHVDPLMGTSQVNVQVQVH